MPERMSDGGEHESLAPVIPLFGGRPNERGRRREVADDTDRRVEEAVADVVAAIDRIRDARGRAVDAAPIADTAGTDAAGAWHPTWASDRAGQRTEPESSGADTGPAEKALLKKLRTRSLSISEARNVLRENDVDAASAEGIVASMEEYGYLDDAALAEQLVHAGVDRKGQGRQAIAQTLAKRGIPRDVADAALAALPDDDLERALDFARSKVRALRDLERDVALRRLTGQLARRGYAGSLALTAARIALDERPPASGGVRFV